VLPPFSSSYFHPILPNMTHTIERGHKKLIIVLNKLSIRKSHGSHAILLNDSANGHKFDVKQATIGMRDHVSN
jgi:hypothetical protein